MQDHCKICPTNIIKPTIRNSLKWIVVMLFMITGLSSSFSQVKLILNTPRSDELFISDLWEVQILNNSNEDILIFLEGSIVEKNSGEIYEGITKTAKIPANTKYNFNKTEVIPDSTKFAFPGITHEKNIFQVIPNGSFTLCTNITNAETMLNLDNECIRIHSKYDQNTRD